MTKILYIAPIRMPTEKAHGLQIVQNCEAFVNAGCDVELWVAWRLNREMRHVDDPFAYYGVPPVFKIRTIPTLDLLSISPLPLQRFTFYLLQVSFIVFMLLRLLMVRADILYSRDPLVLLALSLFNRPARLVYEAHTYASSKRAGWLHRTVARRVGSIVAITPVLRDDLIAGGADPARTIIAHDGIRKQRFLNIPDQKAAREFAGWSQDAFIVGFVGRLQMLGLGKGVELLIEAVRKLDGVSVALVGGPDDMAEELRQQWITSGGDAERFIFAGHVPPDDVPAYLSAFDVCAMSHPGTRQFAYYTSPLKLFEYMASGRAIVAPDLPGWADVVQQDENALLFPSGDVDALAAAIQRLQQEPETRSRLTSAALTRVMAHYTWDARARMIIDHITS